jgi:hypothetical protein
MAKASKAPHVTKVDIEQYLELDARRRALMREASDIAKQQAEVADKLSEFVAAHGGRERSCTRSGYVLAIITKPGSVSWKPEFIRVAGEAAAEALIAAAPPREALTVTKT